MHTDAGVAPQLLRLVLVQRFSSFRCCSSSLTPGRLLLFDLLLVFVDLMAHVHKHLSSSSHVLEDHTPLSAGS